MDLSNIKLTENEKEFIPVSGNFFEFDVADEEWLAYRVFGVKIGSDKVKISIYQSENEQVELGNWIEKIQQYSHRVNATLKVFDRNGNQTRQIPLNLVYDDYEEEWNWDSVKVSVAATHVYFHRI